MVNIIIVMIMIAQNIHFSSSMVVGNSHHSGNHYGDWMTNKPYDDTVANSFCFEPGTRLAK